MADHSPAQGVYDLLILVDSTASMTRYLDSLVKSLPQIFALSALTNSFANIGLLAYTDYDQLKSNLVKWSGWVKVESTSELSKDDRQRQEEKQQELIAMAQNLKPRGGTSWAEAVKTALAKSYEIMRPEATTLMLLYADAEPHTLLRCGNGHGDDHYNLEINALQKPESYGGDGHWFADWPSAARMLSSDHKKVNLVCLLDGGLYSLRDFDYLSAMSEGRCLFLGNSGGTSRNISEITTEVLMSWMGVHKPGTSRPALNAKVRGYYDTSDIGLTFSEKDPLTRAYCGIGGSIAKKMWEKDLSGEWLDDMPKRANPVQDFAQMYKTNAAYRQDVTRQLKTIIELDVEAMSLNAVFGSLWRAVCNDKENEGRQELVDSFGQKVQSLPKDSEASVKMKAWLEESYDYTAEVTGIIAKVPEDQKFPLVFLDPTLSFEFSSDRDDESTQPITAFRRDELLEIGRSCDPKILRRLGRVLTRLTYVETAEQMPSHIAATDDDDLVKVPMALASPEFGRQFWRILLHLVVPGTMLSARPASVLAALSIRLGITPLRKVAEDQLKIWKPRWNNIEVPETWNANCLGLLVDADTEYRREVPSDLIRHEAGILGGLLIDSDRVLFQRLIDYKLLDANLDTELQARVSWTPAKTSMPIGPVVQCQSCKQLRSVTMMSTGSLCGLCAYDDPSVINHQYSDVSEARNAVWYECRVPTCRAQYIVYNVHQLNVQPKCHYCRQIASPTSQTAPVVECSKCLSRMIWPHEYRTEEEPLADWICIGCCSERNTVIDIAVTANELREDNGDSWLLANRDKKLATPLQGRSLFHSASTSVPLDDFCDKVEVLPAISDKSLTLLLRNRPIQNTPDVISQLQSWITKRRAEIGTCSLCFSAVRKPALLNACGRSGCNQRVCASCLEGWYGLNGPGRIINTAALHCPFCRRSPSPKLLARWGMGIHAVGDLQAAVDNAGRWYYAWCRDCGFAREYIERVCAGGAPPEPRDFECDSCRTAVTDLPTQRPCPGCGIPTQKSSGCDHMVCAIPACGVHWCFFCGEAQTELGVYKHMSDAHGGFFGDIDGDLG